MSLLDTPAPVQLTPVQRAAKQIERAAPQMFNQLLSSWEQGVSTIWDNPTPQAVLDQIEADGFSTVEVFTRSGQLMAFLETQKTGCTANGAAKIKAFTVVNGKILIS